VYVGTKMPQEQCLYKIISVYKPQTRLKW